MHLNLDARDAQALLALSRALQNTTADEIIGRVRAGDAEAVRLVFGALAALRKQPTLGRELGLDLEPEADVGPADGVES